MKIPYGMMCCISPYCNNLIRQNGGRGRPKEYCDNCIKVRKALSGK